MQTSLSFNMPIKMPQMLFGSDIINNFGDRVESCRMEGDSKQSTIEPCQVVAFVDCGGRVLTPGFYVFTGDIFSPICFFIKRIELLPGGSLKDYF